MHPAAEAVELGFEGSEVDLKAALQAENLKIIAARRRLDLAAVRTEEGGVGVTDGAGPTLDGNRGFQNIEHKLSFVSLAEDSVSVKGTGFSPYRNTHKKKARL
jgi:hypothetical protein